MKAFFRQALFSAAIVLTPVLTRAQTTPSNPVLEGAVSLEECVKYALDNQPDVKQAQVDQAITDRTIKSKLADWYPQVNFNYNLQHYLQLPVTILPDLTNPSSGERREVKMGVANSSTAGFTLNQTLFTRDLLLARQSARDVRTQADLTLKGNRIATTVAVSKAFYDVLLTRQQLDIAEKDIARIKESLKTAFNQYKGGLVDKIDYKRATIALNNAQANQTRIAETLKAKYTVLKNNMGYPAEKDLTINNDEQALEAEVKLDTTEAVSYDSRVEYQLLYTLRNLRQADVRYQKNGFLPTLSAFLNYNFVFQNNEFAKLYGKSFPNSLFGVTLAYPIFQGGKRNHLIKAAELQLSRMDWDFVRVRNAIRTEYDMAMAAYKANLVNTTALRDNVALAQEVYDVIQLQYKSGVKTYLDVIVSQNDLQNAQFNYSNAMYQLVSSKIDVDQALGKFN